MSPKDGQSRWRFLRSTEELTSEELQRSTTLAGAMPIKNCADRQKVDLRGTIEMLVVRPQGESRWLEARLNDGSGSVTLIWMGRREIPGITAGRNVRVRGRLSDCDGQRRIYNPEYELLP